MTKKELVRKNIELTFDFIRYLIAHPGQIENLPEKCDIEFIEKDYSQHSEKELKSKRLIKVEHNFELV